MKRIVRKLQCFILALILLVNTAVVCYAKEITVGNEDNCVEMRIENEDNTLIQESIEKYSIQRESEFEEKNVSTLAALNVISSDSNSRSDYIKSWKDDLDIKVIDADTNYSVNKVLEDSESCLKLLVYEWVWIKYVCNGYDEIEEMGFGTDHILEFEKKQGELYLINDTYSEITGYENGDEEEFELLEEEKYEESVTENYEASTNETIAPLATYNESAAIQYSNKWCGNSTAGTSKTATPANYNPSYYYYSGKDCCNFVSQCLKAGGMSMAGTWKATLNTSGKVTADSSGAKSGEAWRYVPSFVSYWKGKGYTATRITSANQAATGNPIYWLASDGYSTNHIMLIVGTNSSGKVLVNGHNGDAYKYPLTLSEKKYYILDLTHNYKTVSSYNATTHTLKVSAK